MKIFFLTFFSLTVSLAVFSQEESSVKRDTINTGMIHVEKPLINDKETAAIDTFKVVISDTSNIKDSRHQLLLMLSVKDFASLDSLFLKYGSHPGLGDVLNLKLQCKKINGMDYLVMGDKMFPVNANEAVLQFSVPAIFLGRKNYLWVKGRRKNGTYTSDYLR